MTNEEKIKVLQSAIDARMKAIKELREKIDGWEGEIIEMEEELNELQSEALFYNLKSHLIAVQNYCKVARCNTCPYKEKGGCHFKLRTPMFWKIK